MNDLRPFEHGEEGTHIACKKRINLEGGKSKCCICFPHEDCELNSPQSLKDDVKNNKEEVKCN
jgi:hypothetical protein